MRGLEKRCFYQFDIELPEQSTIQVGTFSGVKSPGMVISSALGGTSKGNSSDTSDKMSEVFPTFLHEVQIKLKFDLI